MKLISWNVNGLRAVITKGFEKAYKEIDADILCLQETKMQQDQITDEINNIFKDRYVYWNSHYYHCYAQQYVNALHYNFHLY